MHQPAVPNCTIMWIQHIQSACIHCSGKQVQQVVLTVDKTAVRIMFYWLVDCVANLPNDITDVLIVGKYAYIIGGITKVVNDCSLPGA